jgi:hypothetical protein
MYRSADAKAERGHSSRGKGGPEGAVEVHKHIAGYWISGACLSALWLFIPHLLHHVKFLKRNLLRSFS